MPTTDHPPSFLFTSISMSILLTEASSNLVQPDYSVQLFNTESVVLSLGDFDDDMEVLKNYKETSELKEKLSQFHKYVNSEEKKKPREKYFQSFKKAWWLPVRSEAYPDNLFEIAANEKQLSMLERRQKSRKRRNRRAKQGAKTRKSPLSGLKSLTPAKSLQNRSRDVEDIYVQYDSLEKHYHDYLLKSQEDQLAFKYSNEGKPEESFKDMMSVIIDMSPPKNCTKVLPIGIQAIECLIQDYREGKLQTAQLLGSISLIFLIWFCIYLAIALPLWCYKGWCCCCCRCKFCYPNKTVNDIQRYLEENPPGTYINPKGEEAQYHPTQKEIELYERLRRSIAEYY